MPYAEHSGHHHYVTVRNGRRVGLLAGPFPTRQEAEQWVEPARAAAIDADPWAHFYDFGTSRITTRRPRPGRLNHRIGVA
jgi:hypothetical protein